MEDESGLELSLGLSCGGSSSKSKAKDASSDLKGDDGSANRLIGSNMTVSDVSFKSLFKSVLENQESKGKQKSEPITQSQENFFTDLGKCSASMADYSNDASKNLSQLTRYQDLFNKTIETADEKSDSNKRKLPFEEINSQNKHDILIDYADIHGSKKSSVAPLLKDSHVSNTTEDGSTGENEDVAESEAECPQSWLASHREENVKSSDTSKFSSKGALSESVVIGSKGLREPALSGKETNHQYGKPTFGMSMSLQPSKVTNVACPPPGIVPSTSSGSNAEGFPSTCTMKPALIANGECPMTPTANTNSMQFAFGYPCVQLPTLETVSSWAFNSQPLPISSFTNRGQPAGFQDQEHFEDGVKTSQGAAPHNTTAALSFDGKPSDLVISSTKYIGGTGSGSIQSEEEGKSMNYIMKANEAMKKPGTEGPAIRPGIAPSLRFGGCGSYPDLPWVSATGQGPNGKTISGVTYKYNENQIKIVCACHGTHMSPEEFVQHASTETTNSENNANLAPFPSSNTANSAQS